MRMTSGRLGVEPKVAIALEANATASNASTSQFASFLVWKGKQDVGTDGVPGSFQFSARWKAVTYVTTITAIGKQEYIDVQTDLPPLGAGDL